MNEELNEGSPNCEDSIRTEVRGVHEIRADVMLRSEDQSPYWTDNDEEHLESSSNRETVYEKQLCALNPKQPLATNNDQGGPVREYERLSSSESSINDYDQ